MAAKYKGLTVFDQLVPRKANGDTTVIHTTSHFFIL